MILWWAETVISALDAHIEDAFNPSDDVDPHKAIALIARKLTYLRM